MTVYDYPRGEGRSKPGNCILSLFTGVAGRGTGNPCLSPFSRLKTVSMNLQVEALPLPEPINPCCHCLAIVLFTNPFYGVVAMWW